MSNAQNMREAAMAQLKADGGVSTVNAMTAAAEAVNASSPKPNGIKSFLLDAYLAGDIIINGDGTVSTKAYHKFVNSELVADLDDLTVKAARELEICTTEFERILLAYIPAQYA